MKANVGIMDKMLRLSLVLIVGALYLVDAIKGMTAIVFGVIATYLIITSFVSLCPVYKIFGYSTVEKSTSVKKRKR